MYEINDMGIRIKHLRNENGLTQVEMAEVLNMSVRSYIKTEKGKRYCGVDELVKMADVFGVSEQYLLHGVDEMSGLFRLLEAIPDKQRGFVIKGIEMIIRGIMLRCEISCT